MQGFVKMLKMRKKILKIVIFSAIGLLILYFLFKSVPLADLKAALAVFNWRFSLLALGFYLGLSIIRALRFNFFLENKIGWRKFSGIIFLYNFWNQILPFRSGELSYLYYVKKSRKVLMGENIASLVTARMFDLLVIVLFSLVAFYFAFQGREIGFDLKKWFIFGLPVISAIFVCLIFFNKKIVQFLDLISNTKTVLKSRFLSFLLAKLIESFEAVSSIKSAKRFSHFFIYSIFIWLADIFYFWAAATSAGLSLGFWPAVVANTLLTLAIFFLPVQTPVNLGTYEGSLVLVFMTFGFERNSALAASFLIHFQNILFAFILLLLAHIFKKWLVLENINTSF